MYFSSTFYALFLALLLRFHVGAALLHHCFEGLGNAHERRLELTHHRSGVLSHLGFKKHRGGLDFKKSVGRGEKVYERNPTTSQ